MGEFAFVFRGSDHQKPEQLQREAQLRWVAWMKELHQQGRIANPGQPLEDAGRRVTGRGKTVHDGPFAEAKDLVNGFIIITARDLSEAAQIAKGCPVLDDEHGSVEVRPVRHFNLQK